jgi:hypothetical protein
MGFFDKSVLKPEGSVMGGIAVAGTVYAIYNLNVGSVSQVHMTEANHPALDTSRKKAGFTAFILVSALTLITRDGNVGALGYGSIIAMEIAYRHGIMVDPASGIMQAVSPDKYIPAETVIPIQSQGQPAGYAADATAGYY